MKLKRGVNVMALIEKKRSKETAIFKEVSGKLTDDEFINLFKKAHPDDVKIIMNYYYEKDSSTDVDLCLKDYFRETFRKRPQYFCGGINTTPKINRIKECGNIEELRRVAFDKSSRLKMFIVKYEMNVCVIFKVISCLNG